ncbi:MAG: bacteriohemerythrin [Pseudomonadota bacterium]
MMEWKSEYGIGVDSVDKQHRQLVEMISRLEASSSTDAKNKEMGNALKFLVDYTNQHFSDEEALMIKVNFPEHARHKTLHKNFFQKVMEVLLRVKKGESISPPELIDFLSNWLADHILEEDKKIGDFIADGKGNSALIRTVALEIAETQLFKKLQKLRTLHEKKLISGDDFKEKKEEYLGKYSEEDADGNVDAVKQKFSFLKTLQKDHLITKEEEKEHKTILFNQIDLDGYLEKLPEIEEKLLYLKSIFEEGLMSEEVYVTYKSKLLTDL